MFRLTCHQKCEELPHLPSVRIALFEVRKYYDYLRSKPKQSDIVHRARGSHAKRKHDSQTTNEGAI